MQERTFDQSTIGARIKQLRQEEKMSLYRFSRYIGASSHAIVRYWELGLRIPSSYFVFQIAQAFGVTADWLLGLTDERRKPGDT